MESKQLPIIDTQIKSASTRPSSKIEEEQWNSIYQLRRTKDLPLESKNLERIKLKLFKLLEVNLLLKRVKSLTTKKRRKKKPKLRPRNNNLLSLIIFIMIIFFLIYLFTYWSKYLLWILYLLRAMKYWLFNLFNFNRNCFSWLCFTMRSNILLSCNCYY